MNSEPKKVKNILLIGNGFDLRTGVKTTFKDFFRFVIYGTIWHNYSKSKLLEKLTISNLDEKGYKKYFNEKIKNKIQVIADIQKEKEREKLNKQWPEKLIPSEHPLEILLRLKDKEEIAENCRKFIETELGQKFIKYLFDCDDLYSALKISLTTEYEESTNLPALGTIFGIPRYQSREKNYIPDDTKPGEGLETFAHIFEAISSKNQSNIALWSDVETVIELFVTQDKKLGTKFQIKKKDIPVWTTETLTNFSEGLDIFESLLAQYFKAIQDINIGNIFLKIIEKEYQDSFRMRSRLKKIENQGSPKDEDY